MESLEDYADKAARLTREEFVNRYPAPLLIKRPSGKAGDSVPPITFRTQSLALTPQGLLADGGAFSKEWWVWPLLKKPRNPFPDRLSLGRATNCDIVFRLGYISKLHAHIVVNGSQLMLVDQGSANGTEVNGVKLAPQTPRTLSFGDVIKLGSLELELIDPGALHDLLREQVR